MKQIQDFEDYFITEEGDIYSLKTGTLVKLKPWLDGKKRYFMITLCKNGTKTKKLIHRLVAMAFIENPNGLPEVNHKNHNSLDNSKDNLEWVTRQQNMAHCFEKHSQIRNFRECELFFKGEKVGDFKSIAAAARYAQENFNASYYSLIRNLKTPECGIIKKCNDHSERK